MAGEIIKEEIGIESKQEEISIEERIEGTLCYLLGFVTGIIFLIVTRHKFVRFHALQSISTFLPLTIFAFEVERYLLVSQLAPLSIPGMTGILGGMASVVISSTLWTLVALLWLLLMYKASKGEKYKLPFVGRLAEKYT